MKKGFRGLRVFFATKSEKDFEGQAFANALTSLEARIAQKFVQERQADHEMEK